MVTDKKVILHRISKIREALKNLTVFSQTPLDEFKKNSERQLAVLHSLQIAIEVCIDIGAHIISADELGVPKNHTHIFEILIQHQIISTSLLEELKKMVRFRNRIVHIYWDIDLDEIYRILKNNLKDFNNFIQQIEHYLSK